MYDEYNNIQVQYMNYISLNKEVNKRNNDQLIINKSDSDTKSPRNNNNKMTIIIIVLMPLPTYRNTIKLKRK